MRKYLAFALIVGLACGEASIVRGENHVSKGSASTQSAETDKRGTEESPLVVNEHPIQSKEEAAEEARKDAEQNRVNERTIDLTFAIAICAGLQFLGILGQIFVYWRQTKIMENTLIAVSRQATTMATQAEVMREQMDVMISKECARLQFNIGHLKVQNISFKLWRLGTSIGIKNIGLTRAYNVRVRFRFVCLIGEDNRPIDDADFSLLGANEWFIDPSNVFAQSFIDLDEAINDLDVFASSIKDRKHHLYLSGFIDYETLGKTHTIPIEDRIWVPIQKPVSDPEREMWRRRGWRPEQLAEATMSGEWMPYPRNRKGN